MSAMTQTTLLRTPLGIARIEGDEDGISKIILEDEDGQNPLDFQETPAVLQACKTQLKAYFDGTLRKFDLRLNPQGTEFQKTVWNALTEIPYGKLISYGDLARKIDNPKAVRAVAAANGRNPLWIVIPCHRVIGSDGSLTGYAGGLWRKKWLLEHENGLTQPRLF